MSTNNKISNIINSQVPFFVRNDHPQFMLFLEAYYEFLEQNGQAIDGIKNVRNYYDIDNTIEQFAEKLYETYLNLFPKSILADRTLLLKHAKEFYLSRGTEKSIRFLMKILFDEEDVEFYYPKKDVLKLSDGKWYVQQSLKITDVKLGGVANDSFFALEKFLSTTATGNISGATAVVERVDKFYEGGTLIEELVLSNIRGTFKNGEEIISLFYDGDQTKAITANVFGGVLNTVRVTDAGSGYTVGSPVIVQSNTGTGANVQIARVSSGNIASLVVIETGAGYRANDFLLISGGGGSGANIKLSTVFNDGKTHPNTYNIYYSQISSEANTVIGNTRYSNLNSSITDPANNWIANSLASFVYSNTGPAKAATVIARGTDYTSPPAISVIANTRIQELGILGNMSIDSGGEGYVIGDTIRIDNVLFGYGTGAAANVRNVGANGTITEIGWVKVPGHITGGAGYSGQFLPTATVVSSNANANGAIITVKSILGEGATFFTPNTTLGSVERLVIYNRGTGYLTPPTLDLSTLGDGKAKAEATIIEGVYKYPGRYLNDDGMLSTSNYLQDRDYYQNFSYVLKMKSSIDKYRQALKDLVHPAGMKVFGEYHLEDMAENNDTTISNVIATKTTTKNIKTYTIANNVIINYTAHGLTNANSVYIEFTTGNIANYAANSTTYTANNIYRVSNVINSNTFTVYSGKYLPGSINVNQLVTETGPSDIYMKEDGYNLFLIGTTNKRVFDLKLSRKYDITTARLNKMSPNTSSIENNPTGLTFKPDGTAMYICGTSGHKIIQYNMSEAWNVNSAVQGLTFNAASALSVSNLNSVQLSSNGKYMYFMDTGVDIMYQLILSQAWNVNTASYLTQKYLGAYDGTFTGMYFNSNGTSMFVGGQGNDRIKEFRLSTAWNVNTATIYANSGSFDSFSPTMSGITFANNGSMLYVTDTTYDLIHQLPMTQTWNVNTAFNGTSTTGNAIVGLFV